LLDQKLWRIKILRTDLKRLMAERERLMSEAECYRLARDCYKVLVKYDLARKTEGSK